MGKSRGTAKQLRKADALSSLFRHFCNLLSSKIKSAKVQRETTSSTIYLAKQMGN
jgi:hypothetical protein